MCVTVIHYAHTHTHQPFNDGIRMLVCTCTRVVCSLRTRSLANHVRFSVLIQLVSPRVILILQMPSFGVICNVWSALLCFALPVVCALDVFDVPRAAVSDAAAHCCALLCFTFTDLLCDVAVRYVHAYTCAYMFI